MAIKIQKLSQENAVKIADQWKFPDKYSFYNMTGDSEDYAEISLLYSEKRITFR